MMENCGAKEEDESNERKTEGKAKSPKRIRSKVQSQAIMESSNLRLGNKIPKNAKLGRINHQFSPFMMLWPYTGDQDKVKTNLLF